MQVICGLAIVGVTITSTVIMALSMAKLGKSSQMRLCLSVRIVLLVTVFLCVLINRFVLMDAEVMKGSFFSFLILLGCMVLVVYGDIVRYKRINKEILEKTQKMTREQEVFSDINPVFNDTIPEEIVEELLNTGRQEVSAHE